MNDFMSIIYIIISILVLILVAKFIIWLLPAIIVIVLAFWIGRKIFGSRRTNSFNNRDDFNSTKSDFNYTSNKTENDINNKKVIDVDYEEVDK